MLICPHCSAENPDTHKFCQTCGHLLTEQPCSNCGALVPVQLERCPVCQTVTGRILYAICAEERFSEGAAPTPGNSTAETVSDQAEQLPAIAARVGEYLDGQQRYRILEVLGSLVSQEFAAKVIDAQPLQPSLLQLQHDEEQLSFLGNRGDRIASEVVAYLDLQADYHSLAMPDIHDAWEENGVSVILLADRSNLPLLSEVWATETVLPLQMLHWLHEMATLWSLLEPHRACHSLLELANLRVDEDHLLCLQRLYFDPPGQSPEISTLAGLWQQMFQQSERTYQAELALLQHELALGKINSADALKTRIEAIAILLQTNDDMTSADQTEPLNLPLYASPDDAADLSIAEAEASLQPNTIAFSDAAKSVGLPATRAPQRDGIDQADAEDSTVPFSLPALNAIDSESDARGVQTTVPSEESGPDSDELPTIILPMRLVNLEDAGLTDVGRQRDHNEDYFTLQTEFHKTETPQEKTLEAKGLYILCDGMGGHAGGEVASALAVETLSQYFAANWQDKLPSETCIREGILQANRAIYELNQEDARSGSGRMGTTLVLVLIQNTEVAIAHVGDSRLYRLSRSRGLEQLTVDHEVGQREIQRGVEPSIAYARPDAYQLTQALGPRDGNFINPDVKFLDLSEDLLLLLCSDGLSDNDLLERQWQTYLEPLLQSQTSLEQGVHQLIDLANEQNGHDNVTALVIRAIVRPNVELLGQKREQTQPSPQPEQ